MKRIVILLLTAWAALPLFGSRPKPPGLPRVVIVCPPEQPAPQPVARPRFSFAWFISFLR